MTASSFASNVLVQVSASLPLSGARTYASASAASSVPARHAAKLYLSRNLRHFETARTCWENGTSASYAPQFGFGF
ncbi:hypothetical protein ZWY2020_056559 [Hordeum vulgare]|nr:hypothetical protein ZWY2020_056559 [Hordeum vulgare]